MIIKNLISSNSNQKINIIFCDELPDPLDVGSIAVLMSPNSTDAVRYVSNGTTWYKL